MRTVIATLEEASPQYVGLLAAKLTAEDRVTALLASRPGGYIVLAQAKGCAKDMGEMAKVLLREFAGKGGGAKDFAQLRLGDPSQTDVLLQRAEQLVRASIIS